MRNSKMLGLAAVAAMGLMAFVGVGTASATTLFTDSAKTIAYPSGTEIHFSLKTGTSHRIQDTSGNTIATCTGSTKRGKTKNSTGTRVAMSIEILTWEGCGQTTDDISLGSLEILWTSGDSGEIIGKEEAVTFNIFGVSCTYGTGEGTTLGTITGGSNPVITVRTVVTRVSGGFLCPSSAVTHGEYVATSPHALHIGS